MSNDGDCYEQQASPRGCLENILLLHQLVWELLLVLPCLALHPVPLIGGQQPALNTVDGTVTLGERRDLSHHESVQPHRPATSLPHFVYLPAEVPVVHL